MRKIQLMLTALIMFQFSCESPEETNIPAVSEVDYHELSDHFKEMFQGALELTESTPVVTVSEVSDKQVTVKLEAEELSNVVSSKVEGHIGGFPELRNRVIYPLPPSYLFNNLDQKAVALEKIVNQNNLLGEAQKMYIKSLSEQILKAESYEEGFGLIANFRNQIVESKQLTEKDKLLLIELAAGSEVALEFMRNDGLSVIDRQLTSSLGNTPFGRTAACTVNWRGAWIDGIVGLTFGATTGFYAGATAGTVVMPIVGTVTGAVNVAVVGGAIGFSTGVVQSIIGDLVSSCSRNTEQVLAKTFASCDLAWDAYTTNMTNQMPSDCFKMNIKL